MRDPRITCLMPVFIGGFDSKTAKLETTTR